MFWFVGSIVLFVAAVVTFVIYALASRDHHKDREGMLITKVIGVVLLVVSVILMLIGSLTVVPSRQVGIPITFGVIGDPMPNGLNWKLPWTTVELMDMTVQSLDASEDNPTLAKDSDNADVFVHSNVRWLLKESTTDEVFADTRSFDGDSMDIIRDKFIQPAHRAAVAEVMATYDPLSDTKPSHSELAAMIADRMIVSIGDRFEIRSVAVTFIDVSDATKERINMLNSERANTRIAEQRVQTAAKNAEANKVLADSVSNPNVLVSTCLDLINEGRSLPAGFQCWPNTDGSIVIPAGK